MTEAPTIVFVDALADEYFSRYPGQLPFLAGLPARTVIRPGLGFSVNIKAELLGGLTPDDLGFFCKWSYRAEPTFRLPFWIKGLGRACDTTHVTSRFAHRLLSRVVGVDLFTIPFDEIDLFQPAQVPEAHEEEFPEATLLSRGGFTRILSGRECSDAEATASARRVIGERPGEPLYVALVEPDAVGHRQGPDSAAMARKLQEVDRQVEQIWESHRSSGRGPFLVFSDHGMAPVHCKPRWDPRVRLGKPGPDRYVCFSDSTMLRFWLLNPRIGEQVHSELSEVPWGRVLNHDERADHGVSDPAHGDVLFLADEGVIPTPSHVGGKHPRAVGMHGYHPDLPSQRAFAGWWLPDGREADLLPPDGWIRARELPLLWNRLARGGA